LRHPGEELHALQLTALLGKPGPLAPPFVSSDERLRLGIRSTPSYGSDAILDRSAKTAYRRRIDELRGKLEEATKFGDRERISRAEEEIESLGAELSRAAGLGGRGRKHGSESERARVNVTNAIRSVLKKISRDHPKAGRYFAANIRTGYFCSYRPDPNLPQLWRF